MDATRIKTWVLAIWLLVTAAWAHAQTEEEMNRFMREKDWVSWQDGILQPDSVQKLFIKEKEPIDFEQLRKFTRLSGLIIIDSPLQDLAFLKDFPELRVLELESNSLKSLEGIQALRGLEEFACNYNFIRDISPLDSLTELRVIKLYDNEFTDLSPIGHLEHVTHLDLSKTKITTLAPIAGYEHLIVFSVYKCYDLRDVSPVQNWHDLTDLNLSFIEIPDFSLAILDSLDSLENLRIQGVVRNNEELDWVKDKVKLEQLTMGKNDNVTRIDSLYRLTNLKYLDIHSNNVKDISVVRNFPLLIKLVMYRNQVEDISPLLTNFELRSLFMFENPVVDYSPLFQMGFIQHLNVSDEHFDEKQKSQLRRACPNTHIAFL